MHPQGSEFNNTPAASLLEKAIKDFMAQQHEDD